MEDSINKIKNYLNSRDEVIAGYIFGSCATERAKPKSDIDIAVLLNDASETENYGEIKLGS